LIFGCSGSLGGRGRRLHLPDVGLDYSIHHWLSFITFYYILPIACSWLILEFFPLQCRQFSFFGYCRKLGSDCFSLYFVARCVRRANKHTTRTHTDSRLCQESSGESRIIRFGGGDGIRNVEGRAADYRPAAYRPADNR
jgi:hypothetical protein